MPVYKCKIAIGDGNLVERTIHSSSLREVKKQIQKDGHFLIKIQKDEGSVPFLSRFKTIKLKAKDFYSFNQEFLTLLRAGLPVIIALDSILEKREDFFFHILKIIRNDISEGESISNAFEKHVNIFSPLYVASLRSGEVSGNIPDAIEEYLQYFKRSQRIKQKIKAAAIYPIILSVCSIFVVAFLLVFVVPAITGTFVETGAKLPLFTNILLSFSEFIRTYFFIIFAFLGLSLWGFSFYLKTKKGKLNFDTHFIRIPFWGQLAVIYSTALFTSSLSTVLGSGLPLNHAIGISKDLIKNDFLRSGIKNASDLIENGEGFARALEHVKIFPDMANRMISAGEEGGNLEKVLKDSASVYENEFENELTILTSTVEPVLMVLMGFVIGFIMLAMYMPIFQMAGTYS